MSALDQAIAKARVTLEKQYLDQALRLAKTWEAQLAEFTKVIEQEGDEWCVFSEDKSKKLGCYDSKKKAQERLRQIEGHKKSAKQFLVESEAEDVETLLTEKSDPVFTAKCLKKALDGLEECGFEGDISSLSNQASVFIAISEGKRIDSKKGLPDYNLEGGIHLHRLARELSNTKVDGAHSHIFLIRHTIEEVIDGVKQPSYDRDVILVSDEDGMHSHGLPDSTANNTNADGEHFHKVVFWEDYRDADGYYDYREIELETTEDGPHVHQLQMSTTAFDGLHTHQLDLPDGSTAISMTPGQVWEDYYDSPPQKDLPPLPPSSLFAALSDEQWGAMRAMEMMTQKSTKETKTTVEDKVDFTKETLPALKMPDPKFIMKRLQLQLPAGLISTQERRKRMGKNQVLVNELAPLEFDASFAWGIVQQEEPQKFDSFKSLPADLVEGLDPYTRKEFGELDETIYFLPLSLVKSFDAPLKLNKPPAGRRLAGKVDLAKEVVTVSKCQKCESPFENPDGLFSFCTECRGNESKITKAFAKGLHVKVIKTEETDEERIIFGAVLVPNETDAQDDTYDVEEVKKACYSFMEIFGANHKIMHEGEELGDKVSLLENYLSKFDEDWDGDKYPAGTWFQGVRANDDDIWKSAKDGELTGWSIGGSAIRESLA